MRKLFQTLVNSSVLFPSFSALFKKGILPKHLRLCLILTLTLLIQSYVNAQTFDTNASAYLELQPQFIEDNSTTLSIYFNAKFEDRVADPVYSDGDNIYDHLADLTISWNGVIVYALEHTSLNDFSLGSDYTTTTFDINRFGADPYREYVINSLTSAMAVSYTDASAYGGNQDVVQVRVQIDLSQMPDFITNANETSTFEINGLYYDRGSSGNSSDNIGTQNSKSYTFDKVDQDDDVASIFNLDLSGNGGTYPSQYEVSFNIKYEDGVFDYDHLEEMNLQWNGERIFALEHPSLKNQNLGSDYTIRIFDEDRVGANDTFREYIKSSISSYISVSYDLEIQSINGQDQDVIRATLNIDREALHALDPSALSGQFRVYADYYLTNEDEGTNGSTDHTGTGIVNVGTVFSNTYSIREEPLDASEELDLNTLNFTGEGYTQVGFKLSDYIGEEISDHIGCVEVWFSEGSGWSELGNIRHANANFEDDCIPDISGQGQEDTFTYNGRTYIFSLINEARIEAYGSKYYKEKNDVEFASGDPYIYIRHYVDSDDFNKSISYKLGGTYILQDFDGEKKQALWNHPGTTVSAQTFIPTTFTEIPDIAAPVANISAAQCGINISWIEPSTTGWGDQSRHLVELLRNNEIIATFDAHDVATHGNAYLDSDILAGSTYDYQMRLTYDRDYNGSIYGDLSIATSLTTDEVEIPAGVATAQTSCDGDLTISWTWPGSGNPNSYLLERSEEGNSFEVLAENIDGALLSYTDNTVVEGTLYAYRIAAFDGLCDLKGDFSPAVTNSRDTIDLTSTIVKDALQTSKGYFNDRTELFWEMTGVNEQFVNQFNVYARELGSTVSPVLIENLERNDRSFFHERGEANVIYEYFVTTQRVIETECGFETTSSFNISSVSGLSDTYKHLPDSGVAYGIGLRNATAVVNGNVTYSGGIAVPDVKVVVERESSSLGRSVYFDGVNDYAQLDHNDVISFDTAMTMTSWIKFENLEKFAVVLEKQGSYGLHVAVDGSAYFYIKNLADNTEHQVTIPASSIVAGQWMNITTTYSQSNRTLKLYINGQPFGEEVLPLSVTGIGDIGFPFTVGRQHGSQNHYFQGFIDETRLYNRALSDDEVLRESGRITKTDTDGLVAYWKIFESTGNFLYDAAHQGSFFYKNDMEMHGTSWSTDIPNEAQLGIAGYTNSFGNFSIEGIPYAGNGENFRVTPTITLAGVPHEFDPGSTSVYLGDGNLVENGVNFEDISAFEISGTIVFDFEDTEGSGTKSVGSAGVQLFLDGTLPMEDANGNPITTDANGNFNASIPIGLHYVSFEKDNHSFSDNARWPSAGFHNFQADVNGIELFDQTLHTFVGSVAGGTNASSSGIYSLNQINNIGEAYFDITSKNGVISRRVETDSLSGVFQVQLPPLEYNLSSIKWSIDDVSIISSGDIESVKMATPQSYTGFYELDSTLTPILNQIYPTDASISAIMDFKIDSLTATKIHYSWTLNDASVVTQRHIWINDTDTVEFFADVDPSSFPTGEANGEVTFAGTNAYNVDSELPNALLLEFVNSSNEIHQVGVVFNGFMPETLFKYDTAGFEYVTDSIFYNARRDFIHRELPTLEVVTAGDTLFTGESSFAYDDPDFSAIDLTQLPYPSFFTNEFYHLEIRANEVYTNKDNGETFEVPVIDGNILVNNGIGFSYIEDADGDKTYFIGSQLSLDEEGVADYYFVGGDPSFVQITSTGEEQNSFTKTINVSLEIDGQAVTWPANPTTNPVRAYVMGASAIPGANFVTKAPETVDFILRDPPGSDSYAYREAGSSFSVSEEFINSGFGGIGGALGTGVGFEIAGGGSFGGHIEIGGSIDADFSAGIKTELEASSGGTVERSMESTETITTNDQPIELGTSDVFVAKSYNLETGMALKVRPIEIGDCGGNCFGDIITMSDGTQFQMGVVQSSYINPEGFPTYVVYTQNHIETVLIPDLEDLRNSILSNNSNYTSVIAPDHVLYGSNNDDPAWGTLASTTDFTATEASDLAGESYTFSNDGDNTLVDSVRWYNQQIRLWEEALAFNEIEKWAAFNGGNVENVSLASGVQLASSVTNTASSTSLISLETSTSVELGVEFEVDLVVGFEGELNAELGLKTTSTSTRGKESSNTFGYVLHDSDENDALSINVATGVGGSGTMFSTVGGQTSCPFEPGIEMKYASPEFIEKAIADRQALILKLVESKKISVVLATQLQNELAAIDQEIKDLENDLTVFAESQIELIKQKADIKEIFDEIQGIVKNVGENAANALVQKAVGPVVGGVNDFIGTLHDINIPVPFTRGVSPFESIPKIPVPETPTGDFSFDFGQVESLMLKRLKDAEDVATETINRTTELITKVQNKIKKRLLDVNNLGIRLAEYQLDLDNIDAEIDALNNQIVQFQALQSVLQNTTEPIMLSNSTLQREKPTLLINGANEAQVYNVPAEERANFTLLLGNESESGDAQYYELEVLPETNPNGLVLTVDGLNISEAREFLVPGSSAIQKILQVERGPFEYDYSSVEVLIKSTCQYDPTSQTALIADTVRLDVSFIPVCSDLAILAPDDNWVGNNQNNGILPITVGEYDINATGLESIKLQYKAQESSDWLLLETFFRDENAVGYVDGNEVLPQSGNVFTFDWDISNLIDGEYDIRAISNCALAEATSEIHSGTIDKVNPHPFGTPQPADGIYAAGDELSIQFNEPINEGLLRPSNFSITGVLNGAEVNHNASLYFNGVEDQYMEIPEGLDFTRKSFTVEMQVKRSATGREILFAQGGANTRSLVVGFNENDAPFMSVNGITVVGDPITDANWHHLAFVYDYNAQDGIVYDNAILSGINNSFSTDYQSSGRVLVGKSTFGNADSFEGYIHELRVWNIALTVTEVNQAATQQYGANKRGLVGIWKMDEAEGSIARDHVRSKHAQVSAQWAVEPGGLAYSFDGSAHLEASSPVFSATTDFTIEFWVNGNPGSDSVTFISNGRGDALDPNQNGWAIGADGSGYLIVKSSNEALTGESIILDDTWHHVALSINRIGNATLFLDGSELASLPASEFDGFGGAKLYLGARGWIDNTVEEIDQQFSGSLDEIRIWSSAKRKNHINNDIQNKLSGEEVGLVIYYPFESYQETGGVPIINQEISNQVLNGDENDLVGTSEASFVENTPVIKLPKPIQKVNFNFGSNNDEIVLTPTVDASAIEDVILTIAVENVKDKNGNRMESPAVWTAFVDRSTLNWVEAEKTLSLALGEGATFEASLFNRGGNVEDFSLSNLPGWLSASPSAGSVEPQESQVVHFTIDENTNIGTYVQDVVMQNSFGFDERLILNLNVYQPSPEDWVVDPADFEFSMSVLNRVRIKGEFSRDENDLVAAFVNGECRGVASLDYSTVEDNYQAFLSIYSNDLNGEAIDYRIWNASEGVVHTFVTSSDIAVETFTSDAFYGSVGNPVIFDAGNNIEQSLDVVAGWQWLSFNLASNDMNTVNDFMVDFPAENGDQIKSAEFFDQYDPATGWLGTITTNGGIQNEQMYKFKLTNAAKFKFRGEPVDAPNTPIALSEGWNWVSFLGQNRIPINEALANVSGLQIGDVIKSQRQFATYGGSNVGWVGSLGVMAPGEGYLYRAAASGSIIYPQVAANSARISDADYSYLELEGYEVNPADYPNNMTMVLETTHEYDYVIALVNNEIRGVAPLQTNPETNSPAYFMTVFGDGLEEVSFISVRSGSSFELEAEKLVSFNNTDTYGTLKYPFKLSGNPLSTMMDSFSIYPNPVKSNFTIENEAYTSVQIVTMSGQIVKEFLTNSDKSQTFDVSDLNNGIYIVKLFSDEGDTRQVKLVKE